MTRKKRRKPHEKIKSNLANSKGHVTAQAKRKTKKPETRPEKAVFLTRKDVDLQLLRERQKGSKAARIKTNDALGYNALNINFDAFGGVRGKLEGSGLRPTFMNVKRKTYKRWSKN